MKKLLNQKEQWYADTLPEAKDIINEAQEKGDLASQKITGKSNKFGPYHLVDLTFSHETPRNLMEEREEGAPDGQLTIEEVETEPEEENYDHIQFEDPNASNVVVTPEDENGLPF